MLAEIRDAEDRDHALRAVHAFTHEFGAKWPKAVAKIVDDADALLGLAAARGVVGNKSTGVIFDVGVAGRQPASSALVSAPTSFRSPPSLSLSRSFAIEASER